MRASRSLGDKIEPKPRLQFQQPEDCPVALCPTITLYEQQLKRHKATEARLRASARRVRELLRQKDELIVLNDVLAKESEHRFLNGLQLINSLLSAQSRSTKSPEAAAQLSMAANRVATLGRVHRHLHTLDRLESVAFGQYLRALCADISAVAPGEFGERSISVEGAELEIPRTIAVPLGFIASELITNAIKYAGGKITVSLQAMHDRRAVLAVSDDGPGLPEAFNPSATSGLGMKIIAALARQIRGELRIAKGDNARGTRFSVAFSVGDGADNPATAAPGVGATG